MTNERFTAEMAFNDDDVNNNNNVPIVIKIRRNLPDFLHSVKLKYVKLGYHNYTTLFSSTSIFLFLLPFPLFLTSTFLRLIDLPLDRVSNLLTNQTIFLTLILAILIMLPLYYCKCHPPIYLLDFSCHKPHPQTKVSIESFLEMSHKCGAFQHESLNFQERISNRSGLGDETYFPNGIISSPPNLSMVEARLEAESVIFSTVDSLLEKTGIKPEDIDILIVNCSLFNPTPSLCSMIINHYKLKPRVKSFNLSGMGCSAGLISIDLAKHLLRACPNSLALVFSTENITQNWYFGNDRSMLLCNCIFRVGGAAVLLSNKAQHKAQSKYELLHTVRTHKGSEDQSYTCVYQREDEHGGLGVSLSRELMAVAGHALKTNITTLGPLVLPWSEQFMFFVTLVRRKVLQQLKVKPYIPDFKRAFNHFCIHAGGRAVLDEIQKNLDLSEWHMEPSRMTLHRFGNTSSSSLWYELAYAEAKGRVKVRDRVWQIAFGSGFKCNSAVWRALKAVEVDKSSRTNPWMDSVDKYPIKLPCA